MASESKGIFRKRGRERRSLENAREREIVQVRCMLFVASLRGRTIVQWVMR